MNVRNPDDADTPAPMPDPLRRAPGAGAVHGRGATFDPGNRFRRDQREAYDDGWPQFPDDAGSPPPRVPTTVTIQRARTIIARNDSPDIPFTQSINPYQGCEHGCVYCYARPSHAYLDLSPGLEFETRLFAKPDAAELLRAELSKPGYVCDPIALGTNTDVYQPIERELRITRQILEVLAAHEHPFTIVTKSALIERDIDLIAPMAAKNMARVYLSVTTLDRDLEAILEAAAAHGASSAGYILLRLPREVAPLFRAWLDEHYPLRAAHVMSLIQQIRGGRDNDPNFGTRMKGTGLFAELTAKRFRLAARRLGLDDHRSAPLDSSRFRPPRLNEAQGELF